MLQCPLHPPDPLPLSLLCCGLEYGWKVSEYLGAECVPGGDGGGRQRVAGGWKRMLFPVWMTVWMDVEDHLAGGDYLL